MTRIKIAPNGTNKATIEVDGVEIPNVKNYRIEHRAGDVPTLYLEIFPKEGIEIEGWSAVEGYLICPACSQQHEALKELSKFLGLTQT